MNYFSQNLKFLRKRKGESQKDLADYLGVRNTSVSNYELGEAIPDLKTIEAISIYYGVQEADFLYKDLTTANEMTINIRASHGSNPNVQVMDSAKESTVAYRIDKIQTNLNGELDSEKEALRKRVSFLEGQIEVYREMLNK